MAPSPASARSRRRCVIWVLIPFVLAMLSALGMVTRPDWLPLLPEPVFVPSTVNEWLPTGSTVLSVRNKPTCL